MAAVSETLVREFFELHGFLVRQQRKHVTPGGRDDEVIDFFVLNPKFKERPGELPFVLGSEDLARLERAVVVVKGWHTETFSPARLENAPEIFRFVEPAIFRQALRDFGDGAGVAKILIVPALPQAEDARQASVDLLRQRGMDAVIPFRTVLADLVRFTETNRNYQKSDLLQIIRVLKNYDFLKEPQMELFKARRRRTRQAPAGKDQG